MGSSDSFEVEGLALPLTAEIAAGGGTAQLIQAVDSYYRATFYSLRAARKQPSTKTAH